MLNEQNLTNKKEQVTKLVDEYMVETRRLWDLRREKEREKEEGGSGTGDSLYVSPDKAISYSHQRDRIGRVRDSTEQLHTKFELLLPLDERVKRVQREGDERVLKSPRYAPNIRTEEQRRIMRILQSQTPPAEVVQGVWDDIKKLREACVAEEERLEEMREERRDDLREKVEINIGYTVRQISFVRDICELTERILGELPPPQELNEPWERIRKEQLAIHKGEVDLLEKRDQVTKIVSQYLRNRQRFSFLYVFPGTERKIAGEIREHLREISDSVGPLPDKFRLLLPPDEQVKDLQREADERVLNMHMRSSSLVAEIEQERKDRTRRILHTQTALEETVQELGGDVKKLREVVFATEKRFEEIVEGWGSQQDEPLLRQMSFLKKECDLAERVLGELPPPQELKELNEPWERIRKEQLAIYEQKQGCKAISLWIVAFIITSTLTLITRLAVY